MLRYGLSDNILDQIIKVISKYSEVDAVIIYGSRAKGNYENGSDIDLTFKGKGVNLTILNKIDLELDDLLLPYTFDLSVFDHIDNPDLVKHINRVGKVIYSK